jgi:phage gp29-like protein
MNQRLIKINKWRAQYNPLRALTFQRAVSLLEEGERGAYADLQWTYRSIEKRDATLRGLVALRLSAIQRLDWDVKVVDEAPAEVAQRQAAALRAAYEAVSNLRQAIKFLARAEFRGFAHLEKRYRGDDPTQPVVALLPVPQWHWVRDTEYGPWMYNARADSGTVVGQPVDLRHFVVREVESPINEIGLLCYLRKNLSQKDWDGFVETYGIPPTFVEMPPNTPPDKEQEYQEMAEAVIGDLRGTLPSGAKVHTAGDTVRGVNPFRDHLTYQDEQLVLAGTSGKLTMLTAPTGLGSGVATGHEDTFDALAQAEAAEISEVFQRQFDRAILDAAGFAGQPAHAYFELAAVAQEDVGKILDNAVKISQAGGRPDWQEISERTGYKVTAGPVQPAFPTAPGAGPFAANRAGPEREDTLSRRTRELVAKAISARLAPVREALQAALDAKDDGAFDSALADARALIERLARAQGLSPSDPLVTALYAGLSSAAVNGALSTPPAPPAQ